MFHKGLAPVKISGRWGYINQTGKIAVNPQFDEAGLFSNGFAVHELVQLKSRDVKVSPVWKGEATLRFFEHPYLELFDLRPTTVIAGYRFSFALTVDDLVVLRDLS